MSVAKTKTRKNALLAAAGDGANGEVGLEPVRPEPMSGPQWDGPSIKAARERVGLTLSELSARTKINTAILRALEEERFEDTPKARVYVRGFVRCMAEEIGLDQDAVSRSYVPRWERWFERQSP